MFLIFISSYIFANGDLFTIDNKIIGVKYDENSSDLAAPFYIYGECDETSDKLLVKNREIKK